MIRSVKQENVGGMMAVRPVQRRVEEDANIFEVSEYHVKQTLHNESGLPDAIWTSEGQTVRMC